MISMLTGATDASGLIRIEGGMSNDDRRCRLARPQHIPSCKVLLLPAALLFLAGCFGEAGGLSAYQADSSWGCKASSSGKIVCPRGRQR